MKINRLNAIEQYIIKKETVSIDELCEVFEVSKNTIRRDLNELEIRGHISKVYGGVTAVISEEAVPIPIRRNLNQENKELIGSLASECVEDGDTIFVDAGSTSVCLLKNLKGKKNITVITHSLTAMMEASKYENLKIIGLGGIYNGDTASFLGISTLENINGIKINKAFMAATGVSIKSGLTNTTYLEAEIKRGVVSRSDNVILMADSTKLDFEGMVTFCELSDIYAFITDKPLPDRYINFLTKNNVNAKW